MFSNCYIGAPCGLERLRGQNEALNAKVLDEVGNNQELVTLNNFEHQSSEYELRKYLEGRIADLESWRWVLKDLSNRLNNVIQDLRYEHKALHVVLRRVEDEISRYSEEPRPGALIPQCDVVEQAIKEELKFLRGQKKKFEQMIKELEEEIPSLENVNKKIEEDALNKEQAIHVDEKIPEIDIRDVDPSRIRRKMKRLSPLDQWEEQCYALKQKGLCALSHALSIRHKVRGCRALLSVGAQSYATRVGSLLKRRLYSNTKKLEDLEWQKVEAQQDYNYLAEELTITENNILDTMDKICLMEARLADRSQRPPRELTRDDVDRQLKDELNRLKYFLKCLRSNVDRITSLLGDLTASIAKINCAQDDLTQVIQLDQDRIRFRTFQDSSPPPPSTRENCDNTGESGNERDPVLTTIREEDEEVDGNGEVDENGEFDDYPFDY